MSASLGLGVGPMPVAGVGRSSRGRHAAIGLLGAIIALGVGPLQPGRIRAQEATPKAEAAKAEPAKAEPARDQQADVALSVRYHFVEPYAVDENPAKPELIVQYQVGSLETTKVEVEQLQGAPLRKEGWIQAVYTERPAKVTRLGEVTDLVRRYDAFRGGGDFKMVQATPPLLKDLVVWCRLQKAGVPEVISLVDQRPLREDEFNAITAKIVLPQLASLLPRTPPRVGDVWKVGVRASRSLLGESVPDDEAFDVQGTLLDVRPAAEGTALSAKIQFSGELTVDDAPASVKAWIFFEFEPPAPPAAETTAKTKAEAAPRAQLEARGHISKILMTRRLAIPLNEARLNKIITKELTLMRRAASNPLKLPDAPPVADKANSWLRYEDPLGRFHFDHPQELRLRMNPDGYNDPDVLELVDRRPNGAEVLFVGFQKKDPDPAKERSQLDPNYHIRNLRAAWREKKREVDELEPIWLPNDAGTPASRRIHRFEAALKNPRAYCDHYLILDAKGSGSFVVTAITERDDHVVFRDQVEGVIRSIAFNEKPAGPAAAPRPATGAAPAGDAPKSPQGRPR